jgi:hypothetical protein
MNLFSKMAFSFEEKNYIHLLMSAHWILKQCPPPVWIYFSKFNNINCDFVSDSGSYFITPHVSQLKAAVFPLLEVKNMVFVANLLKFVVITLLSTVLLLLVKIGSHSMVRVLWRGKNKMRCGLILSVCVFEAAILVFGVSFVKSVDK